MSRASELEAQLVVISALIEAGTADQVALLALKTELTAQRQEAAA